MACDKGNCSGDVGRVGVAESRERTKKSPKTRKKRVSSHKSNTHTALHHFIALKRKKKQQGRNQTHEGKIVTEKLL